MSITTIGTILRTKAFPNGTVELFDANGKLHNDGDMPACVALDGSQAWFRHGKLHRETGPAFIDGDGTVHYWLDGEFVDQDDSARNPTSPPKPVVTIETLRSLFRAAPTKEVEDAVLAIAERHGHPAHTVCF